MADNQNDNNLDELLNDIALEPDNATTSAEKQDEEQETSDNEELEIDNNDESLEVQKDDESDATQNDDDTDDDFDEEELLEEKEYAVQKKQTKLQKILIGVAAGLVSLIVVGSIAYFTGFFDQDEPEVKEDKTAIQEQMKPKTPDYNFRDKDINVDRLNKKLNMLTKYEIIEDAKKEEEKALEKEKLHQEAQRKLEEERLAKIKRIKELENKRLEEELEARTREQELLNSYKKQEKAEEEKMEPKEEIITVKKENKDLTITYEVEPKKEEVKEEATVIEMEKPEIQEEAMPEVKIVQMETPKVEIEQEEPEITIPVEEVMIEEEEKEESSLENNFIKFIVIETNKKDIYKKELDQITTVDDNISLCRDGSNNIEIFVGPYDEHERDIKLAVFKYALKNKMVEAIDFTQEEFDKRCNF